VQFNGNLLIGKAYTALLGSQPGDEFEVIKFGQKARFVCCLLSSEEATTEALCAPPAASDLGSLHV